MSLPLIVAMMWITAPNTIYENAPSIQASPNGLSLQAAPEAAIRKDPTEPTEPLREDRDALPSPTGAPPPPQGDDAVQSSIVVIAHPRELSGDPLRKANVKSFEIAQDADQAFVAPVSLAYKHRVPEPLRQGLQNFLNNLQEPDVFLNFLLQMHPGKAAETFARFAVNSTVGVAGLVDLAKRRPFNLPRRRNGFADSMGYYGVKPGPFLFLPLIGATTVRDAIGGGLDRLVLPLAVGFPFNQLAFSIPAGTISALDHRIDFDDELTKLRNDELSPYAARRDYYLRQRQAEIDGLHGRRDAGAGERRSPTAASHGRP